MDDIFKKLEIDQIVVASSNIGKINQIKNFDFLKGIEILPASDFNLPEIEETGETLEWNAILKARYCYIYSALPTLSDDTGFFINALDGFPGIHCGRLAGDVGNRNFDMAAKIINDKLGDNPDRSCVFSCAVVFIVDYREYLATGDMPGTFVYPARTGKSVDNGGYNPYFIPEYSNLTYAQSGITSEPIVSHRSIAMQKIIKKVTISYQT